MTPGDDVVGRSGSAVQAGQPSLLGVRETTEVAKSTDVGDADSLIRNLAG
jgi:hypothetical protein